MRKGAPPERGPRLTKDVKVNLDLEFQRRAFRFLEENARSGRPFFLYNYTLMHFPVIPREDYRGSSGNGDWADCLLQMDGDFGDLLDRIDELGLREDTVVVFAGDNGAEDLLPDRGTSGFWEGSYFTGMEGSLRTPCLVRWPGRIPAGRQSNEIVHVTDWFATLLTMAGLPVPGDRVIDGVDQSAFLYGHQERSNREGFPFWVGDQLYGVKWKNFKLVLVQQKYLTDPAPRKGFLRIINLMVDPKEREPYNARYLHTWTVFHFGKLLRAYQESIQREPPIPAGAPLDYVPLTS